MGGGFKQNLNVEVSPARIEKEVAIARERLNAKNSANWRKSRKVSATNSLEDSNYDEQPIGFAIE